MVFYKTEEEVAIIKESAKILAEVHGLIASSIKEGVKTSFLDELAYRFIIDRGAYPSFKDYQGFPNSLCISVNEVVVHGIPDNYLLKQGDIVSIDCGVLYKGFHSDSAYTYGVGEISDDVKKLLDTTKESLFIGIENAKAGNRLGDVGNAIQVHVETNGFSVVRELVGHGIGKSLHESPEVPNYGKKGNGFKLLDNLVIAIEPMVNMGRKNIYQDSDGWTIRTSDKKPSAHFEHTVLVNKNNPEVLTSFKFIEEALN
ncbi:MAG: type I methionyl aminopeptidase [Cytophagales bacterium]|nr:MAG: type I methionyl aminopeptidase [Cytophagales bacterium]